MCDFNCAFSINVGVLYEFILESRDKDMNKDKIFFKSFSSFLFKTLLSLAEDVFLSFFFVFCRKITLQRMKGYDFIFSFHSLNMQSNQI